jgi:hypothetical protein
MLLLIVLIFFVLASFIVYASFKNIDDENIRKELEELIKEIEKELFKNETIQKEKNKKTKKQN